jgi:hypothetical protein
VRSRERCVPVGEELLDRRKQRFAGRCQLDATSVAPEQGEAELPLELADLLRECGLGYAEAFRGAREVELLCHGREVAQVAHVDVYNH